MLLAREGDVAVREREHPLPHGDRELEVEQAVAVLRRRLEEPDPDAGVQRVGVAGLGHRAQRYRVARCVGERRH